MTVAESRVNAPHARSALRYFSDMRKPLVVMAIIASFGTALAGPSVEGSATPNAPASRADAWTYELEIGTALLHGLASTPTQYGGVGALSVGVGRFITPNFALSGRIDNVLSFDDVPGYYTTIGPDAQLWFGQVWIGAGLGFGFAYVCQQDCTRTYALAGELRVGYAFSKMSGGTNISLQATKHVALSGPDEPEIVSLLVGGQVF